MEQEIFDDYIWNEHKKILTADKHKIPGLRNLSHFTPMAPGVPVPLHYHSDIIELHFMVKGQRKTYVMKGGVRTSYCATGNNLFITRPYELHTTGHIAQNRCEFFAMQLDLKEHDNFLGLNQHYSNILCHRLLNMDQHLYHVGSSQISMLANAIGSLASLLKRFLGFAGFYLLSAAFEGVSTAALALMEEPIVTKAQASRGKQTLRALPGQFTKLARNSLSILRTTPLAAKLIVSSAVVSVPSYLTKMFLQQRLIELGWPTELLFLPLLLGGLACVAGTEVGRRVRCRSMRRLYSACALLCGVGTLLVGAAPAWGGILGMMLVQGVLEVYLLHESQKLNDAIPSDQRATLISVDSMAYSLLMIPASPLVGAVGDAFGQAGAGLALLGGVIVLSGVALLGKKPQES